LVVVLLDVIIHRGRHLGRADKRVGQLG
jgi:hypothetical protein